MGKYDRQMDIIDVEKLSIPIHILGAGGIGSWTALMLAKMGCSNITIYDDDVVEEHNVASQFFKEKQLGDTKIDSIYDNVLEHTGIEIQRAFQEMESKIEEGLVIIAIDSMSRRIEMANMFADKNVYIIDGRMGGLQLEIYSTIPSKYLATTCEPDGVDHDNCTAKAIGFNCATIGSWICNNVRLFIDKKLKDNQMIFLFDNYTLLKKEL